MTIYEKIKKIIDIVLDVYPMGRLFKNKIMNKVQKIPEPVLKRILSEMKNVLEEK